MSEEIDCIKNGTKKVIEDLLRELEFAEANFPEYRSYHEGWSLILEELDELWELVRAKGVSPEQHYNEVIQVACCAVRYAKMCNERIKEK
jgi:hypothetical protein